MGEKIYSAVSVNSIRDCERKLTVKQLGNNRLLSKVNQRRMISTTSIADSIKIRLMPTMWFSDKPATQLIFNNENMILNQTKNNE